MSEKYNEDPLTKLRYPWLLAARPMTNAALRLFPLFLVFVPLFASEDSRNPMLEWWSNTPIVLKVGVGVALGIYLFQSSLEGLLRKDLPRKWISLSEAAARIYQQAEGDFYELLRGELGSTEDPDQAAAYYIVNAAHENALSLFEVVKPGYPMEKLRKGQLEALELSISLGHKVRLENLYVQSNAVSKTFEHLGLTRKFWLADWGQRIRRKMSRRF